MKPTTEGRRTSRSLIETGDSYIFNGLVGSPLDLSRYCIVRVIGISVTGSLQITLQWFESDDASDEPSMHSTPYDLASQLIEEQIWQAVTSK